jgi:hypothetical protein
MRSAGLVSGFVDIISLLRGWFREKPLRVNTIQSIAEAAALCQVFLGGALMPSRWLFGRIRASTRYVGKPFFVCDNTDGIKGVTVVWLWEARRVCEALP